MVKMLQRWLPVVLWMWVMWHFSAQPSLMATEVDWLDFVIKKSAHLGEYAILFLLSYRAFGGKNRAAQKAFLLGLIYAFSDETHQMFTPGRTALLRDVMVFDGLGLISGWLIIWKVKFVNKWLKK